MILAGRLPDLEDVRRLSSLLAVGTAIPGRRSVRANKVVRNIVKKKLARNETVASMTVRLARGVEIAQIAKTAGFDMIYIDLEHSSFSLDTAGQICLAALSAGITPVVRVPSNTPDYISRVLDGGARCRAAISKA
jgi:4-hydroxy-2-oxoheptanedioate aldolase